MPEIILCAAIDFNGNIICGHRHGNCYDVLKAFNVPEDQYPERDKQGFLTSENRFVSREEAWKIAIANNQVRYGSQIHCLISENLY